MKAHLRQCRLSPKKANLVAAMVRRMDVVDALALLKRIPKKASLHLYKVIASAMANAERNDGQDRKDLYIKELLVNKGPALRRSIPMARGRARPIDKFMSHITVKLGVRVAQGAVEKKRRKDSKEAKGRKETKDSKEKKEVKNVVIEKGVPTAHAPGNPAKQSSVQHADDDPHAGGSAQKQSGGSFTQHRQGSRGE